MIPRRDILPVLAFATALAVVLLLIFAGTARAQTASCTTLATGATQDITAFSVCRKVTLNSVPAPSAGVAGICVPTTGSAAEWASFYNNPPAGVTIAACSASCTGYSYGGYCYFHAGDAVNASCDTVCASRGGCNLTGTRYISSADSSSARCSAVSTALAGVSVTSSGTTGGTAVGCYMNTFKGGWLSFNMYSPAATCAATTTGRICACGGGPVNGQCDGSGGCAAGTYQYTGNGYRNCPGVYGPFETYNCVGSGGGSTANCIDGSQFDSCCGSLPC